MADDPRIPPASADPGPMLGIPTTGTPTPGAPPKDLGTGAFHSRYYYDVKGNLRFYAIPLGQVVRDGVYAGSLYIPVPANRRAEGVSPGGLPYYKEQYYPDAYYASPLGDGTYLITMKAVVQKTPRAVLKSEEEQAVLPIGSELLAPNGQGYMDSLQGEIYVISFPKGRNPIEGAPPQGIATPGGAPGDALNAAVPSMIALLKSLGYTVS